VLLQYTTREYISNRIATLFPLGRWQRSVFFEISSSDWCLHWTWVIIKITFSTVHSTHSSWPAAPWTDACQLNCLGYFSSFQLLFGNYYASAPIGWRHYAMISVVCLSACLSHARPYVEMGIASWNLAGGKPITRVTNDSKRSKAKFSRWINAETENMPYLRNGKAYKLQTWCMDGVRWPTSPTCVIDLKGQRSTL